MASPAIGTSLIIRVETQNAANAFGNLASSIGDAGGTVSEIDTHTVGKTATVRDLRPIRVFFDIRSPLGTVCVRLPCSCFFVGVFASLVEIGRHVHVDDADLAGLDVLDALRDRRADVLAAVDAADADRALTAGQHGEIGRRLRTSVTQTKRFRPIFYGVGRDAQSLETLVE
jgi:hypothetical protein